MTILEKEVWIRIDGKTVEHYENLNYKVNKYVDKNGITRVKQNKILVKVEDLTPRSNIKLTKICDMTGCNKYIPNQSYNTILSKREENGGKDYCFLCGNKISAKTRSLEIEKVKELLRRNDLRPLFNTYSNGREKLLCETKEGYKVVPLYDNIKAGKKPRIFSKSNPYTIENIKHFIKLNNIEGELLSTEFISAGKDKLLFECKNNHEFLMSWDVFSKGHGCPECKESKGEKEVRRILDSYDISYVSQYDKFSDLIGIGGFCLRFDFALFNDNRLVTLIEYDGEFHFKKQYKEDNYEMLVEHDKRKNEYCEKNNIHLLRIPYWEFGDLQRIIEELLNKYKLIKIEEELNE